MKQKCETKSVTIRSKPKNNITNLCEILATWVVRSCGELIDSALTNQNVGQQVSRLPRVEVEKGEFAHPVPEEQEVGAGLREAGHGLVLRQHPQERPPREAPQPHARVLAARGQNGGPVAGTLRDEEELRDPPLVAGELVAAPELPLGVRLVHVDVFVTPKELMING